MSKADFVMCDEQTLQEIADLLKVMAHPTRLRIIHGLSIAGECSVGEMQECLHIPQSSLSTHLQKLRAVGLVRPKRKGLEVMYEVIHPLAMQLAKDWLNPVSNEYTSKLQK